MKKSLKAWMKNVPSGPMNAPADLVSDLRKTGETLARMISIANRLRALGLDPVKVLGLKPWEAPSVGTITERQFQILESAAKNAEDGAR